LDEQVPATSGLMRLIRVLAPSGTIVNALTPSAVAGGNVETSQRIVDVLLKALALAIPARIPAASQGTMNNFSFGGIDTRRGQTPFAYYETIAGGTGGVPVRKGNNGAQSHMTNTLNTPTEVLEHIYPVRLHRYALRKGSGGPGKFPGGNGIVREIEMLTDVQAGILSDRRKLSPYGLKGGSPGSPGKNEILINGKSRRLPSKCSFRAPAGAIIRIETPGGGGWGKREKEGKAARRKKKSPKA
jgi:N-methylhydantoinase B